MPSELALLVMSFLTGILIGLTSMGGAALMTPFLILVLGVRPALAVGTDLAYGAITKWAGAWAHWRQGTVDWSIALLLACGSIPGGVAGVLLLSSLQTRGVAVDSYMRSALGVVLIIVGLILLARSMTREADPALGHPVAARWRNPATIAWGAVVGLAVGITSVGSGSLVVPFLAFLYTLPVARLVGTDVFHAAILVTATAALHWQAGNVEWSLLPWLCGGAIPGVLVGSRLTTRLPQRFLRLALSVVLLAVGAKLVI